jgi:hypothetical protein
LLPLDVTAPQAYQQGLFVLYLVDSAEEAATVERLESELTQANAVGSAGLLRGFGIVVVDSPEKDDLANQHASLASLEVSQGGSLFSLVDLRDR